MPDRPTEPTPARLRAFLQLCRAPNVFTAAADVLMGYLFTHPDLEPFLVSLSLVGASCLLYTAGMVLNDVFDLETDTFERPDRPLPSGRISVRMAVWLGAELLFVGSALAWLASSFSGQYRGGLVAMALVAAILLYDRWLKRTPLGPLGMGACRFLNVLLGMSAANESWSTGHYLVAGGIGLYIVGVTWFARTEAETSHRWQLILGTLVIAAGLALLAYFPRQAADLPAISQPKFVAMDRWPYLWAVIGLLIGSRCVRAIAEPTPARVQAAVKSCIFSLIVLNGVICFAVRGVGWAVVIFALLLPMTLLGRWIYST